MAIIPTIAYETKLQERLDAPSVWKEVLDVNYTNTGIIRNPYLTDSTVATGTRGTGYTSVAVATVEDTFTVNQYIYSAQHIDDADLAQKTFSDFMEIATNIGTLLDEQMETEMLLQHAQWTNFDNTEIGGAAGNITVAVANIKDIVAAMKRKVRVAGGAKVAERDGFFIQWREADYEKLELLASSEGFNTADDALKNGIMQGFRYMGVEHYSTSSNVSGHCFGGVKKSMTVGVVKSTYGKMKTIINPVVSSAQISGVGLESRVDHEFNVWTNRLPVIFDILVA